MELVNSLLQEYTQYSWVQKSSSFVATVTPDVIPTSCLCVSNRDTHEIKPGTLFIDKDGFGFLLIVPFGSLYEQRHEPTHEVVFALTDNSKRRTGVLKKLFRAVPSSWHLWLEADGTNKDVWRALGFTQRKQYNIRNKNVDWGDSIEMERHAAISNRIEFQLPNVVVL